MKKIGRPKIINLWQCVITFLRRGEFFLIRNYDAIINLYNKQSVFKTYEKKFIFKILAFIRIKSEMWRFSDRPTYLIFLFFFSNVEYTQKIPSRIFFKMGKRIF